VTRSCDTRMLPCASCMAAQVWPCAHAERHMAATSIEKCQHLVAWHQGSRARGQECKLLHQDSPPLPTHYSGIHIAVLLQCETPSSADARSGPHALVKGASSCILHTHLFCWHSSAAQDVDLAERWVQRVNGAAIGGCSSRRAGKGAVRYAGSYVELRRHPHLIHTLAAICGRWAQDGALRHGPSDVKKRAPCTQAVTRWP